MQDGGRSLEEGNAILISQFPEWEKEIKMYYGMFTTAVKGEIPGMYELISELKQKGIHVFGLTNWSAETFPLARDKYPIFSLMEDMVVSGEVKVLKPSPEIYRQALEQFGIEASETIFVDDNIQNVAGADAVGITGIQFTGAKDLKRLLEEKYHHS